MHRLVAFLPTYSVPFRLIFQGALVGFSVSLILIMWIGVGTIVASPVPPNFLPVGVKDCNLTSGITTSVPPTSSVTYSYFNDTLS